MVKLLIPFVVLSSCLALSSCVTTADAERELSQTWPGKPVDSFFMAYGPPVSSYKLSNGGVIYTWRGGRLDQRIPADYQIVRRDPFYGPYMGGPPFGPPFGPWFNDPQIVMVSPAQTVRLSCEAQITTDKAKRIQSIRISGDTEGEGFSQSRCADVFGVAKSR